MKCKLEVFWYDLNWANTPFVKRVHGQCRETPRVPWKSVPFYRMCPICSKLLLATALQWRHNERDGVSNHRLNRLFRRKSKKTSKLRVTGLCEGNSPVTGGFLSQRSSNAEKGSIWWRHNEHEGFMATYTTEVCPMKYARRGIVMIYPDWGRDKMDAISQTTFSNGFSWMKMYEFRLTFHCSLLLGVQLHQPRL